MKNTISAREAATRWGVGHAKVLGWIRTGQLRAINTVTDAEAQMPIWRITWAEIERFEASRASAGATAHAT